MEQFYSPIDVRSLSLSYFVFQGIKEGGGHYIYDLGPPWLESGGPEPPSSYTPI